MKQIFQPSLPEIMKLPSQLQLLSNSYLFMFISSDQKLHTNFVSKGQQHNTLIFEKAYRNIQK